MREEWKYHLLSVVNDRQWHSYYDLITLGVVMGYWGEESYREYLEKALECQWIKARTVEGKVKHDWRDCEFQATDKGVNFFTEMRNTRDGRAWLEQWTEKRKYFAKLQVQELEAQARANWRKQHGKSHSTVHHRRYF